MKRLEQPSVGITVVDGQVPGGSPGMSRRSVLQSAAASVAGVLLNKSAVAKPSGGSDSKAKAVIQIWLWGGPCHIDTFDPKPDAGRDYVGPLNKSTPTKIPGLHLGQLLTELAKIADKFSIIRSMTHGVNAHETATYLVQTGRPAGRLVYPCVGAVVTLFKAHRAGYRGLIPPYVVLTQPLGRFSEAGFLGTRYKPFATGGDPARTPFVVQGIVAEGISDQRQRYRRELLGHLNTLGRLMAKAPAIETFAKCEEQAYDMILGEGRKVWDLTQEEAKTRERYGRNTFGQSCLMARRLIERGVCYVTINYRGWDTHKQHFQVMQRKLPELDRGLSALLQDLSDRGLLDTTIVWCSGEFGRRPKVQWEAPWNGGRGHWGQVFSTLVAGGGFQGGCVVGESDAKGEEVKDRPVYPWDLIATMYKLLGIGPDAKLPHPEGLDISAVPQPTEENKSGGLLTEIT